MLKNSDDSASTALWTRKFVPSDDCRITSASRILKFGGGDEVSAVDVVRVRGRVSFTRSKKSDSALEAVS